MAIEQLLIIKMKALIVLLTALVALLSQQAPSQKLGAVHLGATISATSLNSSFLTSRSSSTYVGSFDFSCSQKVQHSNCQYNGLYFSSISNDTDFTLNAFSTSDPATAFANLICTYNQGTSCKDGSGKKVAVNQCSQVSLPVGC